MTRLRDKAFILAESGASVELTEIPQSMVDPEEEAVLIPNTGAAITAFITLKMGANP